MFKMSQKQLVLTVVDIIAKLITNEESIASPKEYVCLRVNLYMGIKKQRDIP